ncbi:hypothetical protein QBC34DRAFT_4564 [Podospora aff. communis PSN243]|uniref:Cytochrome b561 domain-containing protein n=1 Tax=Podospora aff. communis PSN243 TaxID=3040156 RepID=A0AAV9H5Y5_9PEZI|nr:hypothetical protein QBC34DRAFT_4564 [Podospora aff. communis PSN243]
MAPADGLSPPGSSSYSSTTLNVGDGTWDFTKNTFLLPNLVGLNFETMRYNGMGNRFSTLTQYHSLILGHGALAALTFLFIVPISVLLIRFYAKSPGKAIKYHAYLQILAVGFTTIIFILGFIAVGPPRNLTNPHHGIGVAIYVMILLQAVGGRLVRHIAGRSFRVHLHRWSGRTLALLGIVQVPLGLTLYGSPKYTFILYALWMAFLLLLYFILDYRDQGHHRGGGGYDGSSYVTDTPKKEKKKGGMGWLGPLAAGAAGFALLRGRKKSRDAERGQSRSPSPSTHRGGTEVLSSPRHSESHFDEKSGRRDNKGGFMNKLFMAGAGVGAGALVGKFLGRNKDRDVDYSAVSTETPSRLRKPRRGGPADSEYSDFTEDYSRHGGRNDRRSPILSPPGNPVVATAAISAAEDRPVARPVTPRQSYPGRSRVDTVDGSDYSSYVSPSRRPSAKKKSGGMGKGILAGMGLGFLAKKGLDRRSRHEEDRRREEEERRSGRRNSRYTGDGYPTPTRLDSKRRPRRNQPASSGITNTTSVISESSIEPRGDTNYDPVPPGAPPPPFPLPVPAGAGLPPASVPPPGRNSRSHSRSHSRPRYDIGEGVSMPPMPPDPHGVLHPESGSETYFSSGGAQHQRHRVRRDAAEAAAAAAAAAASAGALAAEQEEDRRRRGDYRGEGTPPSQKPVSVNVKVHHDRDRNITLRRLTEEEAAAERRTQRRRADSVSSQSEADTPTGRRYRRERDTSQRRAEAAAEQHVENDPLLPPLSPPNPAFAAGRRPQGKDSAYYSGQPGPSGGVPQAGATMSSLGDLVSPAGSRGDFSAISPAGSGMPGRDPSSSAAADRRRRRRIERREGSSTRTGPVEFD